MSQRPRPPSLRLGVAIAVIFAGILIVVFVRYQTPRPTQPLFAARILQFKNLPGWQAAQTRSALAALDRSCSLLPHKVGASPLGEGGYAGTVRDWAQVCERVSKVSPASTEVRELFEANFVPVEVLGEQPPLFTGYYEPLLNASRLRHGVFQHAIYGTPANLANVDLGIFIRELKGAKVTGCVLNHQLHHCPTRAEIGERGIPQTQPLFYGDDPIAIFFLHIQGSGRLRLDDGTIVRAAYAGQNGRRYTAIGRILMARRILNRGNVSMQAIRQWMKAHPEEARRLMAMDESYVFFAEKPLGDPALGSPGSEGVPLTPLASAAIDPRIHPFGIPVYISATQPTPSGDEQPLNLLLVAQDSGGAIRGPARADIFWGFGRSAEWNAGHMKSSGRFFVLLPKRVAARLRSNPHVTLQ